MTYLDNRKIFRRIKFILNVILMWERFPYQNTQDFMYVHINILKWVLVLHFVKRVGFFMVVRGNFSK